MTLVARTTLSGTLALLVALLACGSSISEEDRDARRASCAKEPGFNAAASAEALQKLRASACKTTFFRTKCADWWDYMVTACVFDRDGARQIEVHSALYANTDSGREHREAMCDAVREQISMTDPAGVNNSRGNRVTTCGKPRKKR